MILSKKSWQYRFYQFCYGAAEPPNNLCGLFWLTLIGILFGVFAFLGCLPAYILKGTREEVKVDGIFSAWAISSIVVILTLVFAYSVTIGMFTGFSPNFGPIVWALIGAIFLIFLLLAYGDKKGSKVNIFIEYLKALKNRVCPIIEWKEEEVE